MVNRNVRLGIAWGVVLLLPACIPSGSPPESPVPSTEPPPTATISEPTITPDTQALIQAATLYSTDFENGYPPELLGGEQEWDVEIEEGGNAIICNKISGDWTSFIFGLDEWENYALSLRLKFLTSNQDQGAEVYLRVTTSIDGYRASIYNNEWAVVSFYPPGAELGGSPVTIRQDEWVWMKLRFVGDELQYFLDDELVIEVTDDTRTSGRAGFGAAPNTGVCVDDILVWGLDEQGNPLENPDNLVIEPYDGTVYSIGEKVGNRPTIPVFYPWSGDCEDISVFAFDCDTQDTPYSLVWIGDGVSREIDSTQPNVPVAQKVLMQSDEDTLYLISEEWHYWYPGWRTLSTESPFYLDEVYQPHVGSEYGYTLMIHFEHPDWPSVMAEKAFNYKEAGFDGMMLDWWHNDAGNGRDPANVEVARIAIAKAIRRRVGDDFILMGNVNDNSNDPTAQYLSGVFMELWKPHPELGYTTWQRDENWTTWSVSIERMEDLLIYWDANLQWPKIIAFEPWKITTGDFIEDRTTEENIRYAKLFAAMAVVIPENGYILYSDNNDDWDGGDHQHAYYDFYHTDFGEPISDRVQVLGGVAYKLFDGGIIAYNRTESEKIVRLPGGRQFAIGPLEGLFLDGY